MAITGSTPKSAQAQLAQIQATQVIDFDSGSPTVTEGQVTPLTQTSGTVSATFSSPFDPAAFSIQSYQTTFFTLSQFSGKYLYDNNPARNPLIIDFNALLNSISLKFATVELHGGPTAEAAPLTLTAYMTSPGGGSTLIGSVSARGNFSGDTYPQGTLSFTSNAAPFNYVRIEIPSSAVGVTDFLVDTITVTEAANTQPLYLSVRGITNEVWYRISPLGTSSWGNWNLLPSQITIDSPAIAQVNGRLYFAVRDMDGQSLRFGSVNLADNSFSGWSTLSGSTRSPPTLVRYGSSLILLFTDATTNLAFYSSYDTITGVWSGSTSLGRTTCDGPAATIIGDVLHLVLRGFSTASSWENDTMHYASLNLATLVLSPWTALPGLTDVTPRLANHETQNRIYLVVKGLDSRIWINIWDGTTWQGWNALATGFTTRSPAATVVNGELHIVVRSGLDDAIWQYRINLTSSVESGWTEVGGLTPSAPTLSR
jgi:hypothetical protein